MPRARPERDRRRRRAAPAPGPLGEFEIIERYFRLATAQTEVGGGDDAAIVRTSPGTELHVCVDTLVAGRHFPPQCPAAAVGHRALAVNLSDLAAMAARPRWATLALTLPQAEPHWLADFAHGFAALAREHGVDLIGGDTTAGPLTVTVTALGEAPRGTRLTRDGAQPGDTVYVSGPLGDAGAGLALIQRQGGATSPAEQHLVDRFLWPRPRLDLACVLREHGHAVIDISDGLVADAGHLAAASGVGLVLDLERLPVSAALVDCRLRESHLELALGAGDDYELCVCAPPAAKPVLTYHGLVPIGEAVAGSGVVFRRDGRPVDPPVSAGYRHF
ncbi:MAG: thiamine-phosphate kinase [Pseudomonadota bacterium]